MNASPATPAKEYSRYASLDGIRGMALCIVFIGHFLGSLGLVVTSHFYYQLFASPVHFLWNDTEAVLMFFILSGFVMHLPFTAPGREINFISFWGRRFFRLYPVFLLHLVPCLLLYLYCFEPEGILKFSKDLQLMLGQSDWQEVLRDLIPVRPGLYGSPMNGPLWTLFVEFKISLLFPLIILLANKLKKEHFALLIAAIWIAVAIFKPETGQYLPMFLMGAFGAQHREWLGKFVPRQRIIQIFVLLALLSIFELRYMIQGPEYLFHSISTLAGLALIILAFKGDAVRAIFSNRFLVLCGVMTYPLYLFHWPI